jgi:3-demethoxyubiquinol 3-hydroxylase
VDKKNIHSMIRVDHAGELGAKWIYEAQIRWTKDVDTKIKLQEIYKQELEHLEFFESYMKKANVRPSILLPLWKWVGRTTGAFSAFLGRQAVFEYTEAVEEVIVKHYEQQIIDLKKSSSDYSDLIEKLKFFKQQEEQHGSTSKDLGFKTSKSRSFAKECIKLGVKIAIKLSKRI